MEGSERSEGGEEMLGLLAELVEEWSWPYAGVMLKPALWCALFMDQSADQLEIGRAYAESEACRRDAWLGGSEECCVLWRRVEGRIGFVWYGQFIRSIETPGFITDSRPSAEKP